MHIEKYLIIYHREDNDGLFSGSLIYDYLIHKLNINPENIDRLPADYNILAEFAKEMSVEELHQKYKSIIMTDISFNDWKYMKKLYKEFNTDFVWCDHHAPIIHLSHENNFDGIPGIRDTQRSAILNVWKYLYDQFDEAYNNGSVPTYLRILSAWDSWTYDKEELDFDFCRNVNKGTTIKLNLDMNEILPIIRDLVEIYVDGKTNNEFSMDELIKSFETYGKILNRYDDIVMQNILNDSGDKEWQLDLSDEEIAVTKFRKACAIFHQGQSSSTLFYSLRETNPDLKNVIVFKHQPNNKWTLSLYNIYDNDSFHCGDFLREKYSGGGHKGAAGCTLTQEQFIKILKNKIL